MSGDQLDFHQGNKETLTGTLHDPGATTGHVLTVQADKSIKAAAGGGGGSGVQVVTVPVSSAQILALHDTDVVLVPGVPGFAAVVVSTAILYQAGLVPYLSGGGIIYVATRQASNPPGIVPWLQLFDTGFLDQANNQLAGGLPGQVLFSDQSPDASDWDGQPVVLFEDTANPTLGDGPLLVTLSYFLAPTV